MSAELKALVSAARDALHAMRDMIAMLRGSADACVGEVAVAARLDAALAALESTPAPFGAPQAALLVQETIERCAKVCEEQALKYADGNDCGESCFCLNHGANDLADAIRALPVLPKGGA